MSKLIKTDGDYAAWVLDLKERYRRSQIKAATAVNSNMLAFYWSIGRDISMLQFENVYGSGFYSTLSRDLIGEIPEAKGFSPTNLKYMKYFFDLVSSVAETNRPQVADDLEPDVSPRIRPQVVDESQDEESDLQAVRIGQELFQIPWGHVRLLIDKCKDDSGKALFYARKTIETNWSRAVLLNFLDTDLYERQGKAVTNVAATLPAPQGDLAQEITKDPYNFDFLAVRERYDERELKDALMDNITKFLLELGTGFAFVGREYRLTIGG